MNYGHDKTCICELVSVGCGATYSPLLKRLTDAASAEECVLWGGEELHAYSHSRKFLQVRYEQIGEKMFRS